MNLKAALVAILAFVFILAKPALAAPNEAVIVITGVTPLYAKAGDIITISGQRFGQAGVYSQSQDENQSYIALRNHQSGENLPGGLPNSDVSLISWSDSAIVLILPDTWSEELIINVYVYNKAIDATITSNFLIKPRVKEAHLIINFTVTCGDDHKPVMNSPIDLESNALNVQNITAYTDYFGKGTFVHTISDGNPDSLSGLNVYPDRSTNNIPSPQHQAIATGRNNPYENETIDLAPFHYPNCPGDNPTPTPTPTPSSTPTLSPTPLPPTPTPSPLSCGSKYDPSNQNIQYSGCGRQFLGFGQASACFSVDYRDDSTSCQWTRLYSPRGLGGLAAPSPFLCLAVDSCDQISTPTFDQLEAISRGETQNYIAVPSPAPSPTPVDSIPSPTPTPTPSPEPTNPKVIRVTINTGSLGEQLLWSETASFQSVRLPTNQSETYIFLNVDYSDGYNSIYPITFKKPVVIPTPTPLSQSPEPIVEQCTEEREFNLFVECTGSGQALWACDSNYVITREYPAYPGQCENPIQPECPTGCQKYGDGLCWRGPLPWEPDDTCPNGYQDVDDPDTGCWGICR